MSVAPVDKKVSTKPSASCFLYGFAKRQSLNKVHVEGGASSSGSQVGHESELVDFGLKQTGQTCLSYSLASPLLCSSPLVSCLKLNCRRRTCGFTARVKYQARSKLSEVSSLRWPTPAWSP